MADEEAIDDVAKAVRTTVPSNFHAKESSYVTSAKAVIATPKATAITGKLFKRHAFNTIVPFPF